MSVRIYICLFTISDATISTYLLARTDWLEAKPKKSVQFELLTARPWLRQTYHNCCYDFMIEFFNNSQYQCPYIR